MLDERSDYGVVGGAAIPPRWAVWAAYAVSLCVLPSVLWRAALLAGVFEGDAAPVGSTAEKVYIVALSVISMALALLTLGLVQSWGEVVPRWVPLLGGRRIPTLAAVIPAALGTFVLLAMAIFLALESTFHVVDQGPVLIGDEHAGEPPRGMAGLLEKVCYLPLLAWLPLLAAVTVAYHRRRAGRSAARDSGWGRAGSRPAAVGAAAAPAEVVGERGRAGARRVGRPVPMPSGSGSSRSGR
jgi:hypothetical protein